MAQTLSAVMTRTPNTLDKTATVRDAAKLMRDEGIGDVIVCNDGQIAGIVTDRDITVRAVADGKDPASTKLGDICSGNPVCLSPDDTVDDAVRLMRDRAIRRLPVVENKRPVGVVSIGDLAVERDNDSALADISAAPANN